MQPQKHELNLTIKQQNSCQRRDVEVNIDGNNIAVR